LVVASSPGGGSDILGRLIAQKLTELLGQQVVVENRAGASGIIGVDLVAKSPPDGYTLILTQTSLAINPSMIKKMPYDAMRDLAPISEIVAAPNVLVVHPSVPAKNVKELIALAKSKPGRLVIASPGLGTSPHLSAELFKVMAKVDMEQVLFKGSGLGVISLLAGEVSVAFPTTPTVMPYLRSGRLRPLGVTGAKRAQVLPEVPTIAEAALPGYESTQWYGILAPAATPRPVIDRLYREISRVLHMPDMQERLAAEGTEVVDGTPEVFAAHIKSETEKWAKVIKAAGIKPE
jgi:tripartite-type tricarboxylate transporter receptor subunit TctC